MIAGSDPARLDPNRFGLVFQSDPRHPGTIAQQTTIRQTLDAIPGHGQKLLWYFAREYKRYWDRIHGPGARHHVTVSFDGSQNYKHSFGIVMDENLTGEDMALMFLHEWGHLVDDYILTDESRGWLLQIIGYEGPWYDPHVGYFERPNEWWAWSFQRLVWPVPLAGHRFSTKSCWAALPDVDEAWDRRFTEPPMEA